MAFVLCIQPIVLRTVDSISINLYATYIGVDSKPGKWRPQYYSDTNKHSSQFQINTRIVPFKNVETNNIVCNNIFQSQKYNTGSNSFNAFINTSLTKTPQQPVWDSIAI